MNQQIHYMALGQPPESPYRVANEMFIAFVKEHSDLMMNAAPSTWISYIHRFEKQARENNAGLFIELKAPDYRRTQLDPDIWYCTEGEDFKKNASDIVFGPATSSWGTLGSIAIFDAPVGGNMIIAGSLAVSRTINQGDMLKFARDNVTFPLSK